MSSTTTLGPGAGFRPAGWNPAGSAIVRPDGSETHLSGYAYTSARPYLCSFGDSINSQDVPADLTGAHSGVSPACWANALSACAFDYMRFDTTLTGTGGTQSASQTFRNGMSGSSGGLVTDRMRYAIDPYLTTILANAGGRPFAVILAGGINDYGSANADAAGYDASIWAQLLVIIQKIIDTGGLPIVKVNEPTLSLSTIARRRCRAALADTVQTWAAGRNDVAVADIEAAWRTYGQGVTWERATRGTTGDEVHPNLTGAIIHGYAISDAAKRFVPFVPPWARSDFANTLIGTSNVMSGTGGTESTGADTAGEVATGWTSTTFGANTSIRCDQEVGPEGYGTRIACVATGAPGADQFGLASATPAVTEASPIYRAFVDYEVRKADYVSQTYFSIRATGSTYYFVGQVGSTDVRAMSAASGATPMIPSGPKLLEGRRLVLSSMPFAMPATPNGALYHVGGGTALTDAAARFESFVRFGGLISY